MRLKREGHFLLFKLRGAATCSKAFSEMQGDRRLIRARFS